MHIRRSTATLAVSIAALCCAATATAASEMPRLPISYVPASRSNYTAANRPSSAIRKVVIHVTEGTYGSAIDWFRNPRARASANYVVSQRGAITEMVPDSAIAWHAGNWLINRESIGIEH